MNRIDIDGSHALLVACEQSQTICLAFRNAGYIAFSNDLLRCYGGRPDYHIMGDALVVSKGNGVFDLEDGTQLCVHGHWGSIIAHPPCTYLTHCSAVSLATGKHTIDQVRDAACFFLQLLDTPCDRIAVENPAPMRVAGLPRYSQIIQPYDFGHVYSKRVCLWLRGLPPLLPTHARVLNHKQWLLHCAGTSRRRSKTFEGIAQAMVEQWGCYIEGKL